MSEIYSFFTFKLDFYVCNRLQYARIKISHISYFCKMPYDSSEQNEQKTSQKIDW